ncbi:hypothetical protein GOBAR_AA03422 [Gossypium barbadense]|uniref:Uncharacterized protein n=1 Tax=Gossypium barbadense TaxID=3634 RepID=A0A2P5YNK6_GOSBA|nr:hypothetical protein GOBAR_AA03422 [Gossypium barbadense]
MPHLLQLIHNIPRIHLPSIFNDILSFCLFSPAHIISKHQSRIPLLLSWLSTHGIKHNSIMIRVWLSVDIHVSETGTGFRCLKQGHFFQTNAPIHPRHQGADVARGSRTCLKQGKATLPLTIPRRVFKSSAKDFTRHLVGITLQGGTRDFSAAVVAPMTRVFGGQRPLLRVGNWATGTCVASIPDSDLEAFSYNLAHGSFTPLAFQPSIMTNCANQRLNPVHVPYWWVNNPTLGEFYFTMIRRADIEGSKTNIAMNAWLPQASYYCDVPPQPNSPPDNVFRPDQPVEADLASKKRGRAPPLIHRISKITRIPLVRTSSESTVRRPGKAPEGAVPSPSPGRHAATRSRRGSSSSSAPAADGFGTGTPVPSPQSQSFSRGYGSILPTSLAYIVPLTRGCSPWRPDAVMSTTGRRRHSVLRIFKGRRGRTGHHATCGALPAAGPYLRLSRFQDSRIPLVRTSSESTVRHPGKAPEGAVPSPSPGRHVSTRSCRKSSSSSTSAADGFGTRTPMPSPQSQSFSRGYRFILPTSLAYIVPLTRGCSPWRPDAVMSTTGRRWHLVLRIFKGRRGHTGHHATCGALPAAGPYLRLSRF